MNPKLFEPFNLPHGVTLRNRIVMAPMTTTAGELDGSFSAGEIAYLEQRAANGVALVMTPACFCHQSARSFERQVGCHTDDLLPALSRCAEAINRPGAASFLQIHHGGNAAKERFAGHPPWAPSAVKNRAGTSELPHAMTGEEIQTVMAAFARAAGRARKAGFTGVEIHGANGYLLQQFFSPLTNRRTDQYGFHHLTDENERWANRTRFAVEVVKAVRTEVGNDYPISYRLSPEEPEPDGYSTAEAVELVRRLVAVGVDMVHVSSRQYGLGVRHDWPDGSHPTLEFRRGLPPEVPVIGVGGILHSSDTDRVLGDGVDLVAVGRGLLMNTDWPELIRSGRDDAIRTSVASWEEMNALLLPERMRTYFARWFPHLSEANTK